MNQWKRTRYTNIEQCRVTGRYRVRKQVKGQQIFGTFDNLWEAKEYLHGQERLIRAGRYCDKIWSLEALYDSFMRSREIRQGTINKDCSYWRIHIKPYFEGFTKANDILPIHVEKFFSIIRKKELANQTKNNILRLLQAILEYGVRIGQVSSNPCLGVKYLKEKQKGDHSGFTSQEAERLIAESRKGFPAKSIPYIGFLLTIREGLRRGEICGLQWQDIDFNPGEGCPFGSIDIVRQYNQFGEARKNFITQPKTSSSIRRIPIFSKDVRDALMELKGFRKPASDNEFILTPEKGGDVRKPLKGQSLASRLRTIGNRLGITGVRVHKGRDTFANDMVAAIGVDGASKMLGHSNPVITNNFYLDDRIQRMNYSRKYFKGLSEGKSL